MIAVRALVALALSGTVAGCGGAPSNYELCRAACDYTRRCLDSSDAHLSTCYNHCDDIRGSLSDMDRQQEHDCTNAGKRRQQLLSCNSVACSEVGACVTHIDDCIRP